MPKPASVYKLSVPEIGFRHPSYIIAISPSGGKYTDVTLWVKCFPLSDIYGQERECVTSLKSQRGCQGMNELQIG
jgi:hypothetical protein